MFRVRYISKNGLHRVASKTEAQLLFEHLAKIMRKISAQVIDHGILFSSRTQYICWLCRVIIECHELERFEKLLLQSLSTQLIAR